jgi:exopolysaccharide biosynthesis WecB/TagA/CpsF family protein
VNEGSAGAALAGVAAADVAPDVPVRILGVPFRGLSHGEAVARIRDLIHSSGSHHVVLANAHTVNVACDWPEYRMVLERASLVLRDGVGVALGARWLGQPLPTNFCGTDFVPALLTSIATERVGIFLYGAAPGVAAAAGRALVARAPRLRIEGVVDGYVDPYTVAERVRAARPDVLLVALGNPLQECWIDANLAQLDARVAIGVGALFDYLAGRVVRAPRWVRALRGEWLFRLLVEPRRLWRRYVLGNPQFLWRVLRARERV